MKATGALGFPCAPAGADQRNLPPHWLPPVTLSCRVPSGLRVGPPGVASRGYCLLPPRRVHYQVLQSTGNRKTGPAGGGGRVCVRSKHRLCTIQAHRSSFSRASLRPGCWPGSQGLTVCLQVAFTIFAEGAAGSWSRGGARVPIYYTPMYTRWMDPNPSKFQMGREKEKAKRFNESMSVRMPILRSPLQVVSGDIHLQLVGHH